MSWPKAIILIDMDAFFASIEQRDRPELMGKPVAVTNGAHSNGSTIITASYEARRYGIKVGMRVKEAKLRCPELTICSTRLSRYREVSTQIMDTLYQITPDIEVFSVDEAFLDVTRCQQLLGTPEEIGEKIQTLIWEATQLTCSVGVAGDKTTAKYAASIRKPAGLVSVHPEHAESFLAAVPVIKLCGIGDKTSDFLNKRGVHLCEDMKRLPLSVLTKKFGPMGHRIWLMCQGKDPSPIKTTITPPQSLGHSKVLPPHTKEIVLAEKTYLHLCDKLSRRLRANNLTARCFSLKIQVNFKQVIQLKTQLPHPSADTNNIYQLCKDFLNKNHVPNMTIQHIQITATDPKEMDIQKDLFNQETKQKLAINKAIDAVKNKFGNQKIKPATLIKQGFSSDVIPPSWQPTGPRQVVDQ